MAAKPKFFSCHQVDTKTQEVSDKGKHPGPSAKAVADALASALPEGHLVVARGGGEVAFGFGKVASNEDRNLHFIVFIGDGDLWVTTPENESNLGLQNSEEYDRKEAYSPDLHVTFRSVVTGKDLVWTPVDSFPEKADPPAQSPWEIEE